MTELFDDLPEQVKIVDKNFINFAFLQKDSKSIARMVNSFMNSCTNEREIDFIDFIFKMKLEELNASNSN